jgi:hypothetical protein
LVLAALLAFGTVSARAGGHYYRGGHGAYHHYPYRWGYSPSVSFYYGGAPYYAPYGYSGYTYPAYGYGYDYGRPNYAVSGTLLGALTGGIMGNSIHHQGWEGAGIGAAAGLLLGGVAEHSARARERAAYSAPPVPPAPQNQVANAPTVPDAPVAPAAPTFPDNSASRAAGSSSMSGANSLFGR